MILFEKYLNNKITGQKIMDVYELVEVENFRISGITKKIQITECDDVEEAWKMMATSDDSDFEYIASLYQLVINPINEEIED